jgi:hypothetical protein
MSEKGRAETAVGKEFIYKIQDYVRKNRYLLVEIGMIRFVEKQTGGGI